jgi:hypothetical protein
MNTMKTNYWLRPSCALGKKDVQQLIDRHNATICLLEKRLREAEAASQAVLEWARTPGNHGGNPYCHDFVKQAQNVVDKDSMTGGAE